MNTLEKIKKLEKELAELKVSIKKPKRWKPRKGEDYKLVYTDGSIGNYVWSNDPADHWRYSQGNCFLVGSGGAEEYRDLLEAKARLKELSEEAWGDTEIDWEDVFQDKWQVKLKGDNLSIDDCGLLNFGLPSFPTRETAQSAIAEIGEDKIKKIIERCL